MMTSVMRWYVTEGGWGVLLTMGTTASVGVIAGAGRTGDHPWLEGLLKGAAGLGVGALLSWTAQLWLSVPLPIALFGATSHSSWTAIPLLFQPLAGAVFGGLVALDRH
ncbi:MAG: hypothetical protein ACPGUV_04965 [Polyangiales bacterium]